MHRRPSIAILRRLLRRTRSFEGGAFLPMHAEAFAGAPIRDLPPPRRLAVPLGLDPMALARPLVEVGRRVDRGERIAESPGGLTPHVHAPLAGRVASLDHVSTAMGVLPAIHIDVTESEPLRHPAADAPAHPARGDFRPLPARTAPEIAALADAAGLVDGQRPPRPLGAALRDAADAGVGHIVVNGLTPEPLLTTGPRLLADHLDAIVQTGVALRAALNARRLWLAVDEADAPLVRSCRSAARAQPARVLPLPNKYPQAVPALLAWTITREETPCGLSPLTTGTLVLEVQPLLDLWSAWHDRAPLTHRVITVAGPNALTPGRYRVPIGAAFADVIERVGLRRPLARLVEGGPMTGISVESLDAVITAQTSALLLIDRDSDRLPSPGPCVRCGHCQEDCPAGLDPQRLLDAFERNTPAEALALQVRACFECGLCSYVCPAQLPLADAAAQLKRLTSAL